MFKGLSDSINAFFTSFKPTYSVSAITYFVVPGIPINKNVNRHEFGKGEYDRAKEFYSKVVQKTKDIGFAPAEVQLIKGKKTVIEQQQFGPVSQLQDMPMTEN
ncbi:MAG: hypothetical protein JXQ90_08900 [Cyclobacteriaceae bacterium]